MHLKRACTKVNGPNGSQTNRSMLALPLLKTDQFLMLYLANHVIQSHASPPSNNSDAALLFLSIFQGETYMWKSISRAKSAKSILHHGAEILHPHSKNCELLTVITSCMTHSKLQLSGSYLKLLPRQKNISIIRKYWQSNSHAKFC